MQITEVQLRRIIRQELVKETKMQTSVENVIPENFDDFKDRMFVALSKAGVSHQLIDADVMYDMWVNHIERSWGRLKRSTTLDDTDKLDEWWELCYTALESYVNRKTAMTVANKLCDPDLLSSSSSSSQVKDADIPIFEFLGSIVTGIIEDYEDIKGFQVKLHKERDELGEVFEVLSLIYRYPSGVEIKGSVETYDLERARSRGIPFTTLEELHDWVIAHGATKMKTRRAPQQQLDDYP